MPYSFSLDPIANIASFTYDSTTSYHDRKAVLNDILDVFEEFPQCHVLIDTREAHQTLTIEQQEEFGHLLGQHAHHFARRKTAIVIRRMNNPHPLIQPIAFSEGFPNIVEFDDMTSAIEWLK